MLEILKKHKLRTIVTAIANIFAAAMMVISGYQLSLILDSVTAGSTEQVVKSIIYLIGVWVVTILSLYINNIVLANTLKIFNKNLKEKMCNKLESLTYDKYKENDPGNYVSWFINDAERIESNSFSRFFDLIYYVFSLIFSFAAIFTIHPLIALFAVVLMIIMLLVPNFLNSKLQHKTMQFSKKQEIFTQKVTNTILGFSTYLSLNKIGQFHQKTMKEVEIIEKEKRNFSCYRAIISALITTISVISQFGLDILTAYLAVKGATNIGAILSMGNISGQFFGASTNLINSYMMISSNKQLFNKYKVTDETLEIVDRHVTEIVFSDVDFKYNDKEILKGYSRVFQNGKKYMLVGESGKGKSTIAKLCTNFIQPKAGSIIYKDQKEEVFDLSKNELCSSIVYLDQTPFIFNESVRYNLTLGELMEENKLLEVLEKVKLSSFIDKLSNGLDTVLEDSGGNISGGEKQRLALARAMLVDSSVIIIDEGTASLDKETTKQIEDTVLSLKDKIIIYITHHYDEELKKKFDEIIVV